MKRFNILVFHQKSSSLGRDLNVIVSVVLSNSEEGFYIINSLDPQIGIISQPQSNYD